MFFASDKDLRKGIPKKITPKPTRGGAVSSSGGGQQIAATTPEDLVELAKTEREQRMIKRELSGVAVKIQSWWRGRHSAFNTVGKVLSEFDAKMNDVEKLNRVLISKGVPGLVAPCNVCIMVWCKLKYVISRSKKNYTERLMKYCQFLLIPVLSQLDSAKNILSVEIKRDASLTSLHGIFRIVFDHVEVGLSELNKRGGKGSVTPAVVTILCETLSLMLGQGEPFKIKYSAELAKAFESFRIQAHRKLSTFVRLRRCLLHCTASLLVNKLSDDTDSSRKQKIQSIPVEIVEIAEKIFGLSLFLVTVEPANVSTMLNHFVSDIFSIPCLTCVLSSSLLRKFCTWDQFSAMLTLLAVPDLLDLNQSTLSANQVINCYQWALGNLVSLITTLQILPPTSPSAAVPSMEVYNGPEVVSDSLLELYLNVCRTWWSEHMLPGVLSGREGIVWRRTGTSMTAVAVPSALEEQVLSPLSVEVVSALYERIIAPYDTSRSSLCWEKYISSADTKEIQEALNSSGYIVFRNALADQQAASTWFTSKWAQKVSHSIQKSFSISSLLPSFLGGSGNSSSSSSSSTKAVSQSTNSTSQETRSITVNPALLSALLGVWCVLLSQASASFVSSDSVPGKAIKYLSFSSQSVDKLWLSLLLSCNDVVKVFSKCNCDVSAPQNVFMGRNNDFNALMCIVAVMKTTLMAMDDQELYDLQRPLPLHQILPLIRCLKILLYKMILSDPNLLVDSFQVDTSENSNEGMNAKWSDFDDETKNRLVYRGSCAKILSSVLSDLYARWARRPFSSASLWEVEEANSSSIRHEIRSSTPLGVALLRTMPWSIDFHERMKIFRAVMDAERVDIQGSNDIMNGGTGYRTKGQVIRIRKARILEDGMDALNKIGGLAIKDRVVVRYINDFGEEEAGIDSGGLFKDFVTDLSARIFDPGYGLFCLTSSNLLYPNPAATLLYDKYELDKMYLFLGRVLGKALFENITLQPQFAHFFLAFMHGKYNFMRMIDDLATLDPDLYKNLMFLKSYEGDIADLSLTFSITDTSMGQNKEVELIPGGGNKYVNASNKYRYINLVAKYYLHDRLKLQAGAFFSGLYQVISPLHLGMFCAPELQILISGSQAGIDSLDLQRHCRYAGGFVSVDRYITRFWSIFEEMSVEDKALLVKFVTSCERPPSLGFAALQPPFTIQRVDCSDDSRLPTASTCFNILKLPTYSTQKVMKDKLLLAIRSKSGFDLS